MRTLQLVLILILLSVSCKKVHKPKVATESETLNKFFRENPYDYINLDKHTVDTVMIENFIDYFENLEREGVFLSRVENLEATDEYIYIFSNKEPYIVLLDKEGNFIKKVSKEGRGPEEFGSVKKASINSKYIYVLDGSNARINIYNHELKFIQSNKVEDIRYSLHSSDMASSGDYVFLQSAKGDSNLVKVFNANTLNPIGNFLPTLIPPGMQPMGVNNYILGLSPHGEIALSYFGLPYVLFFNKKFEHRNSIVLDSKEFENMNIPIPSLEPKPDKGGGMGVPRIVSHIEWTGPDTFIFASKHILHVVKKREDQSFELVGRYKLDYKDPKDRKAHEFGVNVINFTINSKYAYVTSPFDNAIYRFPLTKLGIGPKD